LLYHQRGNRLRSILLFISGSASVFVLLVAVSALRGQATLFGPSSATSFTMNVHDIPGFRIYSRSVQIAALQQRWGTLTNFALGYVIASLVIALLAIAALLKKRTSFKTGMRGAALCALFFSWFELESAAPTSYLIYLL